MPAPKNTQEVSITFIRKNIESTDLLLKTLQSSISPKKIFPVGNLGAKVSFFEDDMDTALKIIDAVNELNIDDEDKIVLVVRNDIGVPKISLRCTPKELISFLL